MDGYLWEQWKGVSIWMSVSEIFANTLKGQVDLYTRKVTNLPDSLS
jgi:hypothetical protein